MIHFDSSSAWYFIFTIFYFEHRDRILSGLVTEESNAQAYPFVDSDKDANNQLGVSIEEKHCIQNPDCKELYIRSQSYSGSICVLLFEENASTSFYN